MLIVHMAATLMGTAITHPCSKRKGANELNYGLRAALASTPMLLMLTATPCALADGTVNVTLEDASEGGNLSGMKMTATPDSVKAGRVTIHATNKSLALVHEVIVVLPPANSAPLPYDDKEGRVIEKRIKDLGEVSDLPRASRVRLRFGWRPATICLSAISRTITRRGCGRSSP